MSSPPRWRWAWWRPPGRNIPARGPARYRVRQAAGSREQAVGSTRQPHPGVATPPNPGTLAPMSTPDPRRLEEDAKRTKNWKRWGPYLSERQWATVREDYSATGECWD